MNWLELKDLSTLEKIKEESKDKAVIIFKHSTRCSTSAMVLSRLERNWEETETSNITPYFLDLISYRDISNEIAHEFQVPHESPQVLIIKDGRCTFSTSHMGISYNQIKEKA